MVLKFRSDRDLNLPLKLSGVLGFTLVLLAACNSATPPDVAVLGGNGQTARVPAARVPVATPTARAKALAAVSVQLEEQKRQLVSRSFIENRLTPSGDRKGKNTNILLASTTIGEPTSLVQTIEPPAATSSVPAPSDPLLQKEGTLGRFNSKLAALQSGKRKTAVTILHIGDSHVASDSFSRGIRDELQSLYGDAGRGAVIPAGAFKYGVADKLKMSAVGNWRAKTALKHKSGPFGISGVSMSSRSSRSTLKMISQRGAFDWAEVTVLTGPSRGMFTLKVGAVKETFNAWSRTKGSKTFRVNARGNEVEVRPGGGAQTTVLNWATGKDRPGIRYVNFGLIGAKVDITKRFDPKLVANDVGRLNPDLIVYGYGTNEGFNDGENLKIYRRFAEKFVRSLQAAAPNADVVFIGAASGLRKRGNRACGGWSVPPKLNGVRKTIHDIARSTEAGYWDWSAEMGGACGINRWAKQGLAAKDRVHLTMRGYRRSAKGFAKWLTDPVADATRVASQKN